MRLALRGVLDDLRALSWRLPFVRRPRQLGMYVRYAGAHSDDEVNLMSQGVIDRLRRTARLGGVDLVNRREIRKPPRVPSDDPYDYLGSVGWKADVK